MEAAFPADEVDRLLVHGESQDGQQRYPSYRDLGKRFGVSHSVIADYSRHHDCLERRRRAQENVQQIVDRAAIDQVANAKVLSMGEMKGVLSDFVHEFWQRLRDGRARADSCGDACQAIKLLLYLDVEAEARKAGTGDDELQQIQERHRALLASSKDIPFELTGLVIHTAETEHVDPVADTVRAQAEPAQPPAGSEEEPC